MENVLDDNLNESKEIVKKKRGGCLTALLIAMFVVNPIIGSYYIIVIGNLRFTGLSKPLITIYILILFSFINLGLAIATWNWRKFGVIGFWISAILILIINLIIGSGGWQSFLGLLGPIILTLLVRPKWSQFK